ncbi:MAG: hypothetical protein ACLRNV_11160 [Flavonifractor plautii]
MWSTTATGTGPTSPRWESDLALAADVVFAASQGLIDHLSPATTTSPCCPTG